MRNRVLPLLALAALVPLAAVAWAAESPESRDGTPPWAHPGHLPDPARPAEPAEAPAAPTVTHGEVHEETEHHPELFEEEPCERPLFWVRGEYLLWWTKNGNLPILVTRGESTDPIPGALGQPNTKVIYGGDASFQDRSGARFTFGMALGQSRTWSVEGNYFFLEGRRVGAALASKGDPVLARPFIDADTGVQDSSLVSYPGVIAGGINIASSSYLQGAEGNVQAIVWQRPRARVDLLGGFRYLDLVESLRIQETTTVDPNFMDLYAGKNINVADFFGTANNFYGGQLGLRTEYRVNRFVIGLLGKVALGTTHESATVRGATTINTAEPVNAAAGLYALSSNSGTFSRNAFAVVPELGVNLGLRVTERLTALVGYTFIYWSRVIRPGDQIDQTLNTTLIPTSDTFGAGGRPHRPAFTFHETDYWAQGVNLGLQYRY